MKSFIHPLIPTILVFGSTGKEYFCRGNLVHRLDVAMILPKQSPPVIRQPSGRAAELIRY